MVISLPVKDKSAEGERDKEAEYVKTNVTGTADNEEYEQFLERRLENILSKMEGAGDVVCMVTLAQSAEQIIEKDLEVSDEVIEETDSQGGMRTTNQNSRTEMTIYHDGENGSPYVSKQISPKVEGVLVLSEGGDNAVVAKNINEAIQALFGIAPHKIRIVKKGG